MATHNLFPGMSTSSTPYKVVNGLEIMAGIMVPDNLKSGKTPIIVRFHGGFLSWLVEYAKANSAIIVGVDYRLLPEHNGREMMEDLADFWHWLFNSLQSFLGSEIEIDLDRILIKGDSAGGYLAVQSALSLGSMAKAMIAVYPPIDLKIPHFTEAYEKDMVGFPMYPSDTVEKHMASVKLGTVVSAATPPARLDLGFSAIQQGNFVRLLGDDPLLFPLERLSSSRDIPSMMILHGKDDSAVPYRSSEVFVEKLKELHPHVKVYYNAVPGCDHGLDMKATLETPWLKEGLDFITPLWLGNADKDA